MWNATGAAEQMRELSQIIERHGETVRRDPGEIEKTVMMPLCYNAAPPRQEMVCQLIAGMRQTTPEKARRSIMIGDKTECLETIDRYTRAGVTHFIFMMFAPYFLDEIQGFAEDVIPQVRR